MTTIPLAAVKVWRVCFTTTDAGLTMVTKADEEIECLLGLLLEVTVWLEVYFRCCSCCCMRFCRASLANLVISSSLCSSLHHQSYRVFGLNLSPHTLHLRLFGG